MQSCEDLPNEHQHRAHVPAEPTTGKTVMTFHSAPLKRPMPEALPVYAARDLTENGDLAQIILDDQIYILRITRAGKLILTK